MRNFIRTIFIFIFISSTSLIVAAQGDFGNSNPEKGTDPLPQNIRETLAKKRIADEKKEFEELIEKGNKAAKMSEELQKSFAENNKFTSQDQTKLKDLEKLLKKIRKDLGGEDEDDEPEDKPKSMANAINELADTTANLYQEIKKTSRLTISAVAIKSSNTILTIVKFLRFGK